MIDKHHRSIAKAISYRVVGTFQTVLISYLFTGKIATALSIGFVETISKIIVFYFHERAWNKIQYGRHPQIDYQI